MELNSVLRRNIDTLRHKRQDEEQAASLRAQFAQAISRFAGSMTFVAIHTVVLTAWVVINLGLVAVPPFDPTFVILATSASVEALFLSAFILISQNRAAVLADQRSELDVQISLLTEHEVTRILTLCTAIAERLQVSAAQDPELEELKQDVAPERVIDALGAQNKPGE
jgi:uncharacterized membrane protein